MKKNRVALILVLFIICSYPVFSNQESCEGTHEFAAGLADGGKGTEREQRGATAH